MQDVMTQERARRDVMEVRISKKALLARLGKIQENLASALAVLAYAVEGGDVTKPIPESVLDLGKAQRLRFSSTEDEDKQLFVKLELAPLPEPPALITPPPAEETSGVRQALDELWPEKEQAVVQE